MNTIADAAVAAKFEHYPVEVRKKLLRLRELIGRQNRQISTRCTSIAKPACWIPFARFSQMSLSMKETGHWFSSFQSQFQKTHSGIA
jgi:hypothetical protein